MREGSVTADPATFLCGGRAQWGGVWGDEQERRRPLRSGTGLNGRYLPLPLPQHERCDGDGSVGEGNFITISFANTEFGGNQKRVPVMCDSYLCLCDECVSGVSEVRSAV